MSNDDDDVYIDGTVEGAGIIVALVCVVALCLIYLFKWWAE